MFQQELRTEVRSTSNTSLLITRPSGMTARHLMSGDRCASTALCWNDEYIDETLVLKQKV